MTLQHFQPLVSVVVPAYNCASSIAETVESVRSQTYTNWELVIVDDGSTDETAQVVTDLAIQESRIRVISQTNRGVSAARNAGMAAARGQYLQFLDADDRLLPVALERVVRAFWQTKADLIKFASRCEPETAASAWAKAVLAVPNGYFYGRQAGSGLAFNFHARPFLWNGAYRRQFLVENQVSFPVGLSLGEDQVFSFATLPRAERVFFLPEVLHMYRVGQADSAMGKAEADLGYKLSQHIQVVQAILADWVPAGFAQEKPNELLDFILDFTVWPWLCAPSSIMKTGAAGSLEQLQAVFRQELPDTIVAQLQPGLRKWVELVQREPQQIKAGHRGQQCRFLWDLGRGREILRFALRIGKQKFVFPGRK